MAIRINKNGRQYGCHENNSLSKRKFIFCWRGVEQNGGVRTYYINNLYDFLQLSSCYAYKQSSTSTYFDRKIFSFLHIFIAVNFRDPILDIRGEWTLMPTYAKLHYGHSFQDKVMNILKDSAPIYKRVHNSELLSLRRS